MFKNKFQYTYIFISKVLEILGNSKRYLPIIFFLFLLSSIFEIFGLGLLGSFVILILDYNIKEFFLFKYFSNFIDSDLSKNNLIIFNGLLILLIFILKAIFGVIMTFIVSKYVNLKIAEIRVFLLSKFFNMDYQMYLSKHSSDFILSINGHVSRYGVVLQNLIRLTSDAIIFFVILFFLIFLNPIILLNLILVIFIILFIYYKLYLNKLKIYGKNSNSEHKKLIKYITEGIEGLKELKILNVANFFVNKAKISTSIMSNNEIKLTVISSAPRYLIELLLSIFVVSSTIVAITFNYNLETVIPTLAIFTFASIRILPMIYQFVNSYSLIIFSSDGVEKLYEDYKLHSLNKTVQLSKDNKNKELKQFKNLVISNVSFRYNNTTKLILNNINFKIIKGDSIGIVGKSGEGKTTFVDVILNLLEIESGEIKYNGANIKNNIQEWRSLIAYLPQNVFLINDSITNNIALGQSNKKIDIEKIKEAIKDARLDDFVDSLPQGLNTFIGERGMRMSGGQKQRLALARAFYFDKEIIILDESTSSLDDVTENEILDKIKIIKNKKTLIVIAHRERTVEHCNTIIKIHNGKLEKIR